jgi:probable rRNA maturation factor
MNVQIDLQIEVALNEIAQQAMEWICPTLQVAAKIEELPATEVSVMIVNKEKMHKLNQEYAQVDRWTDVLSFPLWEPEEDWVIDREGGVVPLGDIVICLPKAQQQAEEYGHSLQRELGFLAVHGFLHLLGYDHQTPEEEEEMFQKQEEILHRVGLRG